MDKLLLERLALAAIARVTGVSQRWLQLYVNQRTTVCPAPMTNNRTTTAIEDKPS
ncbi:hypothetical protein [Gloeocapsopsis dulcis]|uniref:hypothetical protein n=1 Tax=Gloeocapsopsis dulcis TaxID=2859516 RepID=UPI0012DAB9DC